jgi:hypothetical protein
MVNETKNLGGVISEIRSLRELLDALKEILLKFEIEDVIESLQIRDTKHYISKISDSTYAKYQTFYIINNLDQPLNVQIKANWTPTTLNAVNVGAPFIVAPNDVEARGLTPDTIGAIPYVFAEVWCTTAPTTGEVIVKVLKKPV